MIHQCIVLLSVKSAFIQQYFTPLIFAITKYLYFVLEQFKEFLEQAKRNNETEELRLFKLIIFGPPRVGKTTLFRVLVDEESTQNSDSTGIFNRQLFKVAVIQQDTTKSQSKWDIIKIQDEISRLKSVLEEKRKKSEKKPEAKNKSDNTASPSLTKVENKMLEQYDQPSATTKTYTSTLMVCYDSGGQPEFFDVMPALATNPTGYIMVC